MMPPAENDDISLRRCLDDVGIGIWEYDHVQDRLTFSPGLMQWIGGDFPAAAGSGLADWMARIHPDDRARVAEAVSDAIDKSLPFAVEYRFAKRGGEWLWLMSRGVVKKRDSAGRPLLSQGAKINISKRKSEEALFKLQQRFSQALIETPDQAQLIDSVLDTILDLDLFDSGGIYSRRPDGGYELVATRGISINFLSTTRDIPPDSDRAVLVNRGEPVCSCLAYGPGCTDEHLIKLPHLRAEDITALLVLPVSVNGKPQGCINLASKHVASIPEAIKDFLVNLAKQYGHALERLQAKHEAQEQRLNLEGFFDALADYVFILDEAGSIQHFNPAVRRDLDYDDALIGRPVLAVHPQRVHEEALRIVGEESEGRSSHGPLPLRRADGTEIMADTRIVHGSWNGKPALIAISRDISELHAAQAELLKRDIYQRALLDNFPFLVWLKDADSRFLAVNAPFAKAAGQDDPKVLVGKTDLDVWPKDLAEHYRADDHEVLLSGQAKNIEEAVVVDGQCRWHETYKSPITLDGKVVGTVGFAREITEKVAAREALEQALAELQQERGFLKTLIGTIPDMIWLKDPHGVYLACNSRFEELYGASEQELIGKTDYDYVAPELADTFRVNDLAAIAAGRSRINEEWLTFAKDGHRELAETTKTPMYDPQGTLIGVLGVAHDITAARQAQAALQEAHERRRLLMDTSLDGIAIINQDHWIIEANPRFAEMLGYSQGELLGLRTWDIDAQVSEAEVRERFADLSTINATFESRHRRKDGSIYDVEISASGTTVDGAKIVLTVCRDISERKRAESVLKESEARFHTLFDNMIEGAALHELVTDAQGLAIDYRIIAANHSYEIILGIDRQSAIGRLASEVYGIHPAPYLNEFADVVARCENSHFEPFFAPLNKHFAVSIIPWQEKGFATIFTDITERKLADQALRESAAALKQAQTVAHIGSWTLDLRDNHLHWSDETYRIFCLEAGAQLSLEDFIEQVHEDDREVMMAAWNQALAGGDYDIEHRILTREGVRWVHERAEFEHDPDGVPMFALGTVQDITDWKLAEQRLRDSEARFRVLADYSPDWDYWLGSNGRYHYVSPACERISGRSAEAFLNDPELMLQVIHPDDRHHWLEHLNDAMSPANQMHEQIILRIETLDGEERWIEHQCRPIHDAQGNFFGRRGINRDITLRHVAEEALRTSEAKLRSIIDNAADAVFIADQNGRYTYVNQEACDLLGHECEELRALSIHDITADADSRHAQDAFAELLHNGQMRTELLLKHKLGHAVPVELNSVILPDGAVFGACRDITERKAKDRELERHRRHLEELVAERTEELAAATLAAETANKTKSAFLANMSHEIRTPMNAIIGLTHLLRRNNQDAHQNERLNKVSDAAQHLLNIINDILDISKIEAGKLNIETTHFEPEKVLSHVVNLMGDKAAEKGLELVLSTDNLPAMMRGDPLRLGQILLNFVSNAIKFTKQGSIHIAGHIIREDAQRATVRFEVNDTGIGITEEQRERLFHAFEQADSSTTRRFGGTGLGLVISKRLVELMGGRIGVDSQAGVGSRFWIELELPNSRKQPKARRMAKDISGTRVLVVDDNEDAREVIAHMLQGMGMKVETAVGGPEALEYVQTADRAGKSFDLVLLDWHMPELDGLETAQRLKALPLSKPPRHLMVTAYGHRIPRHRLDKSGVEAVLSKPVTPSGLFDALAEIYDSKHETSQPAHQSSNLEALRVHSGARILIAEDNAINQEVALALLHDAGLQADLADHGAQALELASNNRYDLILMDVQMPVMDGLTATRSIHLLPGYADVPILAMTANAFTEDREACLNAGMCDHVPKPVDPEVLYTTLLKWLGPSPLRPASASAPAPVPGQVEAPKTRRLPDDIPGLDTSIGLKSLRGNVASYLSLLCKFAENHDNDFEQLRDQRRQGAHTEARRTAHSLKGAAGALGAVEVQRLAADLEAAIAQNDSEETIQTLSNAAEEAQRRLSRALREHLDCHPTAPAASHGDALILIESITALLQADDLAAQEAMRDAKPRLEAILGSSLLPICRDIDAFDYQPALEKLRIAAQRLGNGKTS
jgi:two-component system sensor histidine kinase/response regulator